MLEGGAHPWLRVKRWDLARGDWDFERGQCLSHDEGECFLALERAGCYQRTYDIPKNPFFISHHVICSAHTCSAMT